MWDRLRPALAPAPAPSAGASATATGTSSSSSSSSGARAPAPAAAPCRSASLRIVANSRRRRHQKKKGKPGVDLPLGLDDPDVNLNREPNLINDPLSPTTTTAAKPSRGDLFPRAIPARHDSRTLSLLQPLFSKHATTFSSSSSAAAAASPVSHVNHDFDLLTGLGIDQNPTTRRYEIRRGVAHRVDLVTATDDQRPGPPSSPSSSPESDTADSPSEGPSVNLAPRHDYRPNVADISPPSSPDMAAARDARRQYDDQDISPIDETAPEMSQLEIAKAHHRRYLEQQQRLARQQKENQTPSPQSQQRSFIPTMRREKRQNQQTSPAANMAPREAQSRERLRGQGTPEHRDQLHAPEPQQARVPSPSFGDRMRNFRAGGGARREDAATAAAAAAAASGSPPAPVDQRPGWRGASGRTTLVAPVADNTDVPPLDIPRKSSKRVAAAGARAAATTGSPPVQRPTASSHVIPADAHHPETAPATAHSSSSSPSSPLAATSAAADGQGHQSPSSGLAPSPQHASRAYPSPPTSGHDARLALHATPTQAPAASWPDSGVHAATPILAIPDQEKAIRRKPPPPINPLALHNPHLSYSSSVYSPEQTPTLVVDRAPDHFSRAPAETWEQPPSRFSVTTYATSAATGTPRVSTDHELPPLPTPPPQVESVMDRKRPVRLGSVSPAINTDQPFKISMASPYTSSSGEPSPSPTGMHPGARVPRTPLPSGIRDGGRTDSMLSTAKALPLAPPELMSANDRVAHLNARLSALGNRRININTAIKQMTELMPQDNLMASEAVLRKREAEKRKVEALKVELADVQREEYELGLKLHRAYKRLDKNAEYEPTTLWVRRVTG